MIPELGHFAAILGLASAIGIVATGIWGALHTNESWVEMSIRLTKLQFGALAIAFLLLILCFLQDDFSVLYVANNSNTELPWYYKVSGTWGAHEGSFLLWTLVTASWTLAVALRSKNLPLDLHGYVLGTMGILNVAFLLFLLASSNPFERLVPNVPFQGADLNPILQDPGQVIHPPMLYIGYIGFAVAFSFGVAALCTGKLDSAWARWTRSWVNMAWGFLTIGIALGSWWAYYELGWGGWWFWDPVENASFMPWLSGIALIHSLAATEKRGAFKNWTILLALLTFSMCLVGAFLVRSGVLTSVHAFAVDPQRGLFLLGILVAVVGGALYLYFVRASTIQSRIQYWGMSREILILINNALLVVAVITIMLGTLYPLGYEWFTDGEKLSVGGPYFNRIFLPLMIVLAFFLALAPISQWKNTPMLLIKRSSILLAGSAVVALVLPWILWKSLNFGVTCAIALALWIVTTHFKALWRQRKSLTLGYLGMVVAHVGFAIAISGVAVTSAFSHEQAARMQPGESLVLNENTFELVDVGQTQAPNYTADRAHFRINGNRNMFPERRNYPLRQTITTEAAITPGLFRDLYISLGNPIENGSWGVRVQEKPLVRWIWLGAFVMALAAMVACLDKRYKRLAKRDVLKSVAQA
ncbi:MAG: heme lyase CcmF/NrfE family subunit [Gammaproteobacteria bacterium]|nr:heme lyase CcmF/NrfE family subunit [Gammaproteobacteria bacterium]